MRPRIYIAGPYSSDPEGNTRRAIEAANQLLDLGFSPYCPHFTHFWHLQHPRPYEDWLELDLEWVRVCAAVLRLPGNSPGADRETRHAGACGIPVCYSVEELRALYRPAEIEVETAAGSRFTLTGMVRR